MDRLSATECETSLSHTDMHYFRTFKEAIYERKLREFITSMIFKSFHPEIPQNGALAIPYIYFMVLQLPLDDLWLYGEHER